MLKNNNTDECRAVLKRNKYVALSESASKIHGEKRLFLDQKESCASQFTTSTTYSNYLIRKVIEPEAKVITRGQVASLSSDQLDRLDRQSLSFLVTQ